MKKYVCLMGIERGNMQLAQDKFGSNITIDDLIITPEHIHTYCLTYDDGDSSDYNDFLCISKRTP